MYLRNKTSKLLINVVQGAFTSVGSRDDTAWPRCPPRHILQFLVGFGANSGCSDELALDVLEKAPRIIASEHTAADYLPSFIEKHNDLSQVSLLEVCGVCEVKTLILDCRFLENITRDFVL